MVEQPRDPLRGRILIGTAERVDFPDWGIEQLRVKIDTGARTSALHVDDVEELEGDRVRFSVVLDRRNAHRRVLIEAPIVRRGRVRSSSGKAQTRLFVSTRLRLGTVEKEVEISLASREPMIFRMLLGRSTLAHDFLVDPSHRYLQSPAKKPKKKSATSEVAAVPPVPPPKKKKKKKKGTSRAATSDP